MSRFFDGHGSGAPVYFETGVLGNAVYRLSVRYSLRAYFFFLMHDRLGISFIFRGVFAFVSTRIVRLLWRHQILKYWLPHLREYSKSLELNELSSSKDVLLICVTCHKEIVGKEEVDKLKLNETCPFFFIGSERIMGKSLGKSPGSCLTSTYGYLYSVLLKDELTVFSALQNIDSGPKQAEGKCLLCHYRYLVASCTGHNGLKRHIICYFIGLM